MCVLEPNKVIRDNDIVKITLLGEAKTIGELRELVKNYPDETSFGFRNQPMQSLREIVYKDDNILFVVFDGDINSQYECKFCGKTHPFVTEFGACGSCAEKYYDKD